MTGGALELRTTGRTVLMPYVMAGITDNWVDYLHAYAAAGADVIEVGLPFSDPMLDGPTIQEASDRALARGARPQQLLRELAAARVSVPLVLSAYANLVTGPGICQQLAAAGIAGLIVPDLPLEESAELEAAAAEAGVALILLAAPATPDERLTAIGARTRGFLYAVSVMGTTGERSALAGSATELARRAKAVTALPVLIGFGVSGPAQAVAAGRAADGVVIGAALMRRVLSGATPDDLHQDVAAIRSALDELDLDLDLD